MKHYPKRLSEESIDIDVLSNQLRQTIEYNINIIKQNYQRKVKLTLIFCSLY